MYLRSDNAKEIMSASHWKQICGNQVSLHTTKIEPHSPCHNSTKQGLGMLKRSGARLIHNTDAPPVLWEWYLDYEDEVKSCTVIHIPRLQ